MGINHDKETKIYTRPITNKIDRELINNMLLAIPVLSCINNQSQETYHCDNQVYNYEANPRGGKAQTTRPEKKFPDPTSERRSNRDENQE